MLDLLRERDRPQILAQALDSRRDARRRAVGPTDHRLQRPCQARDRDRERHRTFSSPVNTERHVETQFRCHAPLPSDPHNPRSDRGRSPRPSGRRPGSTTSVTRSSGRSLSFWRLARPHRPLTVRLYRGSILVPRGPVLRFGLDVCLSDVAGNYRRWRRVTRDVPWTLATAPRPLRLLASCCSPAVPALLRRPHGRHTRKPLSRSLALPASNRPTLPHASICHQPT